MARKRKAGEGRPAAAVALVGLALARSTARALLPPHPAFLSATGPSTACCSASKTLDGVRIAPLRNRQHSSRVGRDRIAARDRCLEADGCICPSRSSYYGRSNRRTSLLRLAAVGHGARFEHDADSKAAGDDKMRGSSADDRGRRHTSPATAAVAAAAVEARAAARLVVESGDDEEGRKRTARRLMRRRANAKIRAIPASASATRGAVTDNRVARPKQDKEEASRHEKQTASRRRTRTDHSSSPSPSKSGGGPKSWGIAICNAVLERPKRYVKGRVDACKLFVATRERVHWASLGMALYIASTTVVPRIPRQESRSSTASMDASDKSQENDEHSHASTTGEHHDDGSYNRYSVEGAGGGTAARTRQRKQRRRQGHAAGHESYVGGGIDATITHLDDHAEELWRNSPAVRRAAAAAATAAAAAAAAEDPAVAASSDGRHDAGALSEREKRQENKDEMEGGEQALGGITAAAADDNASSTGELHGDDDSRYGESVEKTDGEHAGASSGVEDGAAKDDHEAGGAATPDLHTHTELGDLEVAAKKALDSLTEEERERAADGVGNDSSGGRIDSGAFDRETGFDESADVDESLETRERVEGNAERWEASNAEDEEPEIEAAVRPFEEKGEVVSESLDGDAELSARTSPRRKSTADDAGEEAAIAVQTQSPMAATDENSDQDHEQEEQDEVNAASALPTAPTDAVPIADADGTEETVETTTTTVTATTATAPAIPIPTPPRSVRMPAPDGVPKADDGTGVEGSGDGRARHSTSFVAVAARAVSPAVCRIDMERLVGTGNDAPFPNVEVGQGSGVIFSSEEGLVLTNAHVVAGARKVTITLTDGRKFLAEVKGSDELSDLAVLKIDRDIGTDPTPLPAATLGDSQELQVGDWVIAVGNPVGLDSTVTLGIVSSMKRSSEEVGFPDRKGFFIQTDAAINPGNSGGPLVNEFGEVVGINTAIRAHTEGIGFAIPINKAKAIMYELAEGKRIEYAYIGIHMTTITPEFALQNNRDPNSHQLIPEVDGAIIMRVLPGTPAADAGLRRHDVVIEMRGRPVRTADEAKQVVDESNVGDILTLKVLRGVDRVVELEVRARDMSEQFGFNGKRSPPSQRRGSGGNAPRSQPRPYPGAPPPAFPWGPPPPAAGTSPAPTEPKQHEQDQQPRQQDEGRDDSPEDSQTAAEPAARVAAPTHVGEGEAIQEKREELEEQEDERWQSSSATEGRDGDRTAVAEEESGDSGAVLEDEALAIDETKPTALRERDGRKEEQGAGVS